MPQLLESTRNYLKSSTKLGRRLSSYRDDSSASEASLHDSVTSPTAVDTLKQHRPSTQNRLSALFTLEGRNRNSVSSEDRALVNHALFRKIGPEVLPSQDQQQQQTDINSKKKRRNSGSQKSAHSKASSQYIDKDGLPRGRSSTMSVSRTVRSTASGTSTYDTRPDDYASMDQYQSHLWRRTILEESIMHSLNLGYGEQRRDTNRTSSDRRSRSLKRSTTGRSRMSREQQAALLAATLAKELPSAPIGSETVIDRSMAPSDSGVFNIQKENNSVVNNKSPYQMLLNPSTSNITHSFASFTLELPEHQVTHVMSSSAVPNLFKLKMGGVEGRSRTRRDSNASRILHTGPSPSPRVLTGRPAAEQAETKENMDPHHLLQPMVAAV
ncbi:hypothetical protein EDD11_004965 [Mortierella claussenii]|nr:hypothetical protein EDD11_004965 [Mortierella claussenii]